MQFALLRRTAFNRASDRLCNAKSEHNSEPDRSILTILTTRLY